MTPIDENRAASISGPNKTTFGKMAVFLGLVLLGSCASVTEQAVSTGSSPEDQVDASTLEVSYEDLKPVDVPPNSGPEPFISLGTDTAIRIPSARPEIVLEGEAVTINFENAPLTEVVHTILGETLDLDYVVDHPLTGNVTIRTRSPIPRDELFATLESVLRNHDALLIRDPNGRYFVSGSRKAKMSQPGYVFTPGRGYSNLIIPLQYISAGEMADILEPVVPEGAFLRVDSRRNILILAGTQTQLDGWLDMIATFDVDQLEGMSVGVFPLKNASVDDVFAELELILRGSDKPGKGQADLSQAVKVMPVKRLNSVLAVSPRQSYITLVQEWVSALDSIQETAVEATLHVYPVANGNAVQLADLLASIYGFAGGRSNGGSANDKTRSGVAPGLTLIEQGDARPRGGGSSQRNMGSSMSGFGADVRVVADEYNNSLLIFASSVDFQRLEATLKQLDVMATQVLIEASIIEVTLTDGFEFGLEWAFENYLGGGDFGLGSLDLGGGLQSQVPGFSYSVTDSAGAVKAVVNALAEKSLINVISTPSVMVLDNHTAAIHVGDQQPIRNASTITTGGNVQNSIQYKDTGVKLQVTPTVNDGGLVTLDIDQSVTDVGPVDAATGQRSFLERNVTSRVAVRSGESIVLGGLIRDNDSSGRTGVPFLMDIPLVGSLFSNRRDASARTELLIFISPRVVENDSEVKQLNAEMRRRMRGLTDFSDLPENVTR